MGLCGLYRISYLDSSQVYHVFDCMYEYYFVCVHLPVAIFIIGTESPNDVMFSSNDTPNDTICTPS